MGYSKNVRLSKNGLRAPCLFIRWNERKECDEEAYPAVACEYNCGICGWNPEVAEKRIEKVKERLYAET